MMIMKKQNVFSIIVINNVVGYFQFFLHFPKISGYFKSLTEVITYVEKTDETVLMILVFGIEIVLVDLASIRCSWLTAAVA